MKRKNTVPKICQNCAKLFYARTLGRPALYCTTSCRVEAFWKRKLTGGV